MYIGYRSGSSVNPGRRYLRSSSEVLEFHSTEGWLKDWLASKAGSASESTCRN
jgi:hypothetical protein